MKHSFVRGGKACFKAEHGMIKDALKKKAALYVALIALLAAGTAACLVFGGKLCTFLGLLLCGLITIITAMLLNFMNKKFELIEAIEKSCDDFAFLMISRNGGKACVSENFSLITGVGTDGKFYVDVNKADDILTDITSVRAELEQDVYASKTPEKWFQLKKFNVAEWEIYSVYDVSGNVAALDMIYSLQAFDSDTGILKREAFVNAVRNAICSEKSDEGVLLIHFIINGMDKLISFSGSNASDEVLAGFAQHLKSNSGIYAGRTSTYAFSALVTGEKDANSYVANFYAQLKGVMEQFPLEYKSNLRISCGYSVYEDKKTSAEQLMSEADFAAFDAKNSSAQKPVPFDGSAYVRLSKEFEKIQLVTALVSRCLIDYHFQPIVNAHTGEIYGYEALMRPQEINGIKLQPLELLEIAAKQDLLYEIERLTFFDSMRHLSENQGLFTKRKLFINCIPGSLLSDSDFDLLYDTYGALFDKVVVEITEGTQILEDVLEKIRRRYKNHGAQIALDDYGTGYSNESTLLSVQPDYIKIDRSLLADIDKEPQKLHLAANLIEFAAQHGITTLAEGVETNGELKTVIGLGVDLVQGFITCKAASVMMFSLPNEIKNTIIDINLKQGGRVSKTYDVTDKTDINIVDIALLGYTKIAVHGGKAVISGNPEVMVDVTVAVDDELHTYIVLDGVNISGKDGVSVYAGRKSSVTIELKGDNRFNYEGIRVPSGSELYITGCGNLEINSSHNVPVGIGGNYMQDYGSIKIDLDGKINISGKGDSIVGIGGGTACADSLIQLVNCSLDFTLHGINVVGIGSGTGETKIMLNPVTVKMEVGAQNAVGIGSKNGRVSIECLARLDMDVSGDNCCGIGTLENGSGNVSICGKEYSRIFMHAKNVSAVGAVGGNVECYVSSGYLDILNEGDNVVGIGDNIGCGCVHIADIAMKIVSKASNDRTIYSKGGKVLITSGNIVTSDVNPIECFAADERRLSRYIVEGNEDFSQTVFGGEVYMYTAKSMPGTERMCVYLPAGNEGGRLALADKPGMYV